MPDPSEATCRATRLRDAEARALALLDRIEQLGLVRPGRSERAIEGDIQRLAQDAFGIEQHWHKRIVRSGPNTLAIAADNPPSRTLSDDDIVFLDLGPVLGTWEADVGRTYAIGSDPAKHALCDELPRQFDRVVAHWRARPDITGAELYAFACRSAEQAGYAFGGRIAGHIVAEFPHARLPGPKQPHQISAENPTRLGDPGPDGRERHWIVEIHLLAADRSYGGFFERLAPLGW